jgi:hypothetical protein
MFRHEDTGARNHPSELLCGGSNLRRCSDGQVQHIGHAQADLPSQMAGGIYIKDGMIRPTFRSATLKKSIARWLPDGYEEKRASAWLGQGLWEPVSSSGKLFSRKHQDRA